MTEQIPTPDFGGAYGSDAVKPQMLSFDRVDYFKLDGSIAAQNSHQNSAMLRFLNDHIRNRPDQPMDEYDVPWISVLQHSNVPTRPKPDDWGDRSWPMTMGAVCRNDQIFTKVGLGGDCYICAHLVTGTGKERKNGASKRTWALAVLREEVRGTQEMVTQGLIQANEVGRIVSVRDVVKEIARTDDNGNLTGEVDKVKHIVKINLGYRNFFGVIEGFARHYTTVLDRDYFVSRVGTEKDTEYKPVPMDPLIFDGVKYDLRDEVVFREDYPGLPDLRKIVMENASQDFYDRFWIPGAPTHLPAKGESKAAPTGGAAPQSAPASPVSEPTPDALRALQERVSGQYTAPTTTPAEEGAVASAVATATGMRKL